MSILSPGSKVNIGFKIALLISVRFLLAHGNLSECFPCVMLLDYEYPKAIRNLLILFNVWDK